MRKVLSGSGIDTTATVASYLASTPMLFMANLFLIGDPEDPVAIRLTDWDTHSVGYREARSNRRPPNGNR
jgi:hypothetical protein